MKDLKLKLDEVSIDLQQFFEDYKTFFGRENFAYLDELFQRYREISPKIASVQKSLSSKRAVKDTSDFEVFYKELEEFARECEGYRDSHVEMIDEAFDQLSNKTNQLLFRVSDQYESLFLSRQKAFSIVKNLEKKAQQLLQEANEAPDYDDTTKFDDLFERFSTIRQDIKKNCHSTTTENILRALKQNQFMFHEIFKDEKMSDAFDFKEYFRDHFKKSKLEIDDLRYENFVLVIHEAAKKGTSLEVFPEELLMYVFKHYDELKELFDVDLFVEFSLRRMFESTPEERQHLYEILQNNREARTRVLELFTLDMKKVFSDYKELMLYLGKREKKSSLNF